MDVGSALLDSLCTKTNPELAAASGANRGSGGGVGAGGTKEQGGSGAVGGTGGAGCVLIYS